MRLPGPFTFIIIITLQLSNISCAQQAQKNEHWKNLRESAHNIGLCIYHVQVTPCFEHSAVKQNLEKLNAQESDVYYFDLESLWAKKRISDWAESKQSSADRYFMLFDIDQKSFKQLYDSTRTSNSYMMFSILDLKNEYRFRARLLTDSNVKFTVSTNSGNSVLTNTLWREFMSNRSGRLDSKIDLSLSGSNAARDYKSFETAFMGVLQADN